MAEAPILSGTSEVSLDEKGRFAMPVRFRRILQDLGGSELVFTRSLTDPCLWIYPMDSWEDAVKDLGALPSLGDPLCRVVQRVVLGSAVAVRADSQGRYLLPPALRDKCQLSRRGMLIGFNRKFELWSCEELEKQQSRDEEVLEGSMDSFSEHGILGDLRI